MYFSARSISLFTVICITRSMRSPSPTLMLDEPLPDTRRHSRIAAENTAAIGSRGLLATRSNRSSRDLPDQKACSNSSDRLFRRRTVNSFSKMIAQHQIEARISITITVLTTIPARKNIDIMVN